MNLLAHLWLAERSDTSAAGQMLGDIIKGRLGCELPVDIRTGIRLHRAIDGFSDAHPAHRDLRRRFEAPLRRYAGILVDIGFDYSLATAWAIYHPTPLARFAASAEHRVRREWPAAAPFPSQRMQGLATILNGYEQPAGIQRALNSVSARLKRRNPLADALPAVLAQKKAFDAALPALLTDLESHVAALGQQATPPDA